MTFWMGAIVAIAVPAILIATAARRWLIRTILLWLMAPVILFFGAVCWEIITRPPTDNAIGTAFYGLMLISSILAIPWIIACMIGFGLGFGLRRLLRTDPVLSPAPLPEAGPDDRPPAAPAPAHDTATALAGAPAGDASLYSGADGAASELSNDVSGLYVSADFPIRSDGTSAEGTLRYEHRIGKFIDGRDDPDSAYAVLIDAATGRVLVDCAAWPSSRITPNADGSLFLHLQQNYFDMLFRIDPATRQFHDHGEGGADQPLSGLATIVGDARAAREPRAFPPHFRRISPDGTILVDLASAEWANSHWVHSPRVTEIASGRAVLDLWDTDWDADISFPGARQVALELRRYHHGGGLSVALDLAQNIYRIDWEPGHDGPLGEAPLADIADGLEASSRRSAAAVAAMPWAKPIKPPRPAAWRGGLLVIIGTLIASAVATIWSIEHANAPLQELTPIPVMPDFNRKAP